mmetsp:Transcript_28329/g.42360  ORF Transcript_28329/g.42360 Transcript_28329/m.42360 type:complete len:514 (+) Transcript_28329:1720-3261(+)
MAPRTSTNIEYDQQVDVPKVPLMNELSSSQSSLLPLQGQSDDVEILNPHHDCSSRRSTVLPATFNLVATIVGGGILSVPLAFQKCGLVLTTALMIVSALGTDFSLYILCSSGRRTGATSYADVCRRAYGPGLELFLTLVLFVFLMFVMVAYMVLVRDIFTPIVSPLATSFMQGEPDTAAVGDYVLLGIVIAMIPFFLQKDLHALRYNCYVGFVSISVLCVAIAYRAWENYPASSSNGSLNIKMFPSSFVDVLFAFPIPILSFMCQFNVLGIQGSLVNPTRQRIRQIIDGAVAASFVLTFSFGLGGYLYAGDDTNGNILLNFEPGDRVIIVGKVGCGVTITLAMAMMLLPCRETLLALGPQLRAWKQNNNNEISDMKGTEDEEIASIQSGTSSGYGAVSEEMPLITEAMSGYHHVEAASRLTEILTHVFSTLIIASICYACAVAAPGVAVVWSICGSSLAFIIAFILPSICYIRIRASKKGHGNPRLLSAWALLIFSICSAVLCSVQTIWRFFN